MSKSLILMANTNSQSVSDGGIVNFGSVIRRYGCNCQNNGITPSVEGRGYYEIDSNVSFTSTAGSTTLQLYQDGVEIPGASATITSVASTNYSISIPTIIRNKKCCDASVITLGVSGTDVTMSNASIEVIKE